MNKKDKENHHRYPHTNHSNVTCLHSLVCVDCMWSCMRLILSNFVVQTLVNKKNFSILPASYRYKLTQLLPECDQDLIDAGVKDHKILAPSDSALANEFFTQAVQVI